MKKDISKLLYIVMMIVVFGASMAFGQGDFFKYSTFYTSMSMETSMIDREDYIAIDKGYEDVTWVSTYDYNLTIVLRNKERCD